MKRIADGFSLAEAPVVTSDGLLLVSDVLGGGVRRFDRDGGELAPLVEGRRGIGGMGQLADGRIVISGRDLSVVDPGGGSTVLAALQPGGTGYNDLTITSADTVIAGMLTFRPFVDDEPTPGVLVSVDPDGAVQTAPLPFTWPNGAGFSSSGDVFYVADFATGEVHRSRWTGSITELHLEPWGSSPTGDADGLAVADTGDVWVAGGAGQNLLRYDADAARTEPSRSRACALDRDETFGVLERHQRRGTSSRGWSSSMPATSRSLRTGRPNSTHRELRWWRMMPGRRMRTQASRRYVGRRRGAPSGRGARTLPARSPPVQLRRLGAPAPPVSRDPGHAASSALAIASRRSAVTGCPSFR